MSRDHRSVGVFWVALPLALAGCAANKTASNSRPAVYPPASSVNHIPPPNQRGLQVNEQNRRGDEVIRQQSADEDGLFDISNFDLFAPSRVFDNLRESTIWRRDEAKARGRFAEAEDLFREGKYKEAAKLYKSAAFYWPDSTIEEDALFMLGDCHFFTDQYPKANDSYAKLLEKYDNSRHLDQVVARQFAMARYWQQLQQVDPVNGVTPNFRDRTRPVFGVNGEALSTYQAIWLADSTGPLADDSLMATANTYFLKGRYKDADYYYGLLRSQFPQSEHLIDAYVLGLRSKLRAYQGAQYDPQPLAGAEELIDQMLTQFPNELGEERQRLLAAKQDVREQRALRDWDMAEFYHKNHYFGATRYYCENLLKDYPDTQLAASARERLVEIEGLPDNPPQRFGWMVRLFPVDRRAQ